MYSRPRRGRSVWVAGLGLWLLPAWWFFRPPARATVEYFFSRRWYRWTLDWMTPITQSVRFPIAVVLFAVLLTGFAVLWTVNWIGLRRVRGGSHWAGFSWGGRWAFVAAPVLLIWFLAFWGAGYRRLPLGERLRFDTGPITQEEEDRLRSLLLDDIQRGFPPPEKRAVDRAVVSVSSAMAETVMAWDGCAISLPRVVKPVRKGLLLFAGTSGLCSPFTLEALVDEGLPDIAFVYTAAHELGHIAGFCSEDEATLVGYIAGLRSKDPLARYACALAAYADLAGQLKADEQRAAFDALPERAKSDLLDIREAYRKYQIPWASSVARQSYDKYLRAQGIKEGVGNYTRGITLLTYAWRNGLVNFPTARHPGV